MAGGDVPTWQPRERVLLSPTGYLRDWTSARVIEQLANGSVRVRFTRAIRGVTEATASPKELIRVPTRYPYVRSR